MSEFDLDEELSKADATPKKVPAKKAKVIDPEDDRKNWPVIEVDFEDQKPNFHYVSVAGTKKDGKPFQHDLKLQRGVEVPVPPSIVNMLRSTKKTVITQSQDPLTGRAVNHETERPPIPWRLVEKGKYIK
jgi:hypothetical protein